MADELLSRYCMLAYHQLGSDEKAADQLGIDRRTVRSRVDPQLLAQLSRRESN